jgi:hypothetical protein
MARLSVEHFRANAVMTPEHSRKSSRLLGIFKSRPSNSPSNMDLTACSPPVLGQFAPPASPTSPTVKPGFEKVGILPSERSSFIEAKSELEQHGGSRVADVLSKQVEELKGVSVPHNVDTSLQAANAGHQDEIIKKAVQQEKENEANVIADAFKDALSEHQKEEAGVAVAHGDGEKHKLRHRRRWDGSESDIKMKNKELDAFKCSSYFGANDQESDLEDSRDLERHSSHVIDTGSKHTTRPAKLQDQSAFFKSSTGIFSNGKPLTRRTMNPVTDTTTAGDDTTVKTNEKEGSPRASLASNIFDDQDPLSQGIREYVESKIAEAMADYECKNTAKVQTPKKSTHVTFRLDVTGLAEKFGPKVSAPKSSPARPKHIGSWTINDPTLAGGLQIGFACSYLSFALLCMRLIGGIGTVGLLALLAHLIASMEGNADWEMASDLMFAPFIVPVMLAKRMACDVMVEAAKSMVAALRVAAEDMEVDVRTE